MKTAAIKVTLLGLAAGILHASAAQSDLLEPLRPAATRATSEFHEIKPDRQKELRRAATFVRERVHQGKTADMTFICTHNSRRSHLAQLWAQTAAWYYGLTNVTTYSGGTEASACNIRTVRALRRAGFSIATASGGTNPVYLAQFSESAAPSKLYSKKFTVPENPQRDFAALVACNDAAEKCPVVEGAALRLPLPYADPKDSDNTPAEDATYDERNRQIAREMFYMMSQVNAPAATQRASR